MPRYTYKYTCSRCGYNTNDLYNFKRHINIKNICNPILSNDTMEDVIKNNGLDKSILKKKIGRAHV